MSPFMSPAEQLDPPGSIGRVMSGVTEPPGRRKPAQENDPDPVEFKGVEGSDSNGARNNDLRQIDGT
jgi:hypothetical protein